MTRPSTPTARSAQDAPRVTGAMVEPWKHYTGDPPNDDNPLSCVFGAGMAYTERLLAGFLGVERYEGGDGSEDFDQDATKTLENILTAAKLYDPEEGRLAALGTATTPGDEPVAWDERPLGASINGRTFAERMEHDYQFVSEAGPLSLCSDWQEFRRCFEALAEYVEAAPLANEERRLRLAAEERARVAEARAEAAAEQIYESIPKWQANDLQAQVEELTRRVAELEGALTQIVERNQEREWTGADKSDGYGDTGWITRDGQYAKLARASLLTPEEAARG